MAAAAVRPARTCARPHLNGRTRRARAHVLPTRLAVQVDDATFKKWFPKWKKPESKPKFRLVCFHNAGSAESNYTGRGLRMPTDNP